MYCEMFLSLMMTTSARKLRLTFTACVHPCHGTPTFTDRAIRWLWVAFQFLERAVLVFASCGGAAGGSEWRARLPRASLGPLQALLVDSDRVVDSVFVFAKAAIELGGTG